MNDPLPIFQVRRAGPNIELLDDPLIQALLREKPTALRKIHSTSFAVITAFSATLQKWAILFLIFVEQTVGAAEQDVGLDSQSVSSLTLRWVGLVLSSPPPVM